MFLFDLLFGAKKKSPMPAGPPAKAAPVATGAASAPGTLIHHDPDLIASLKHDHGSLLERFQHIASAAATRDLMSAQMRLKQFRTMIQDHLLKENVRLYVYLEHLLKSDTTRHELMHGFRHEMDGIGRAVIGFLDKYAEIGARPDLAGAFATELSAIGEALVARIRREEELLYPMYLPPAGSSR